ASGSEIEADASVVATGAWTPRLASILGCRIPIEPGKGYLVVVTRPARCPRVPAIFPEHRVAVTPFADGMRIGSIMELAGYDDRISDRRLKLLTEGASHYLADPVAVEGGLESKWFGWRPMTYDSAPVIGRCPGFEKVFLATGHNMLGLSMATGTGRLIQEFVLNLEPHLAAAPYSPKRFF
ncbi:MAG: FAD-dependent oxidoreductase, partial [Pirellulales bacterium]|nr:FAD-dependent oxidoreductase [Pirellulales bacterium]